MEVVRSTILCKEEIIQQLEHDEEIIQHVEQPGGQPFK